MKSEVGNEEIRWQVVKAMIDEFPGLKDRVKIYVEEHGGRKVEGELRQGFVV